MPHNYGDVDNADATGNRNPYFVAGTYKCKIVAIREHTSRPPKKEPFYIIDAEILESDVESRPVGMVCSHMIKVNQDMGPINIKRFLLASNGLDPQNKDNNDLIGAKETIASVEQKTEEGRILGLQCYTTETQGGSEFTVHQWQQALPEDQVDNPLLDTSQLG